MESRKEIPLISNFVCNYGSSRTNRTTTLLMLYRSLGYDTLTLSNRKRQLAAGLCGNSYILYNIIDSYCYAVMSVSSPVSFVLFLST